MLTIALCATACASSSSAPDVAPDLTKAQERVDQALNCPQPPPVIKLCQDGSLPGQEAGPDGKLRYTCALPATIADAIRNQPLPIVLGKLAGLWKKEVDLRFQALQWDEPCHAPSAPAVDSAPATVTTAPAPPAQKQEKPQPWWHLGIW